MEIRVQLENDLKSLIRTRNMLIENRVFIQEEINVIESEIDDIRTILSVLKD